MSQQAMRVFSTEFKQGVVLRLDGGERLAAVADELKIKRKLLYEWRAAYRAMGVAGLNRKRGPKKGFWPPAPVRTPRRRRTRRPNWRGRRRGSPSWSARSASSRWTSIFFAKPCGSSTRWRPRPARRPLRGHRNDERARDARRPLDRPFVRAGKSLARRLLSLWRVSRARAGGSGLARQNPEHRDEKPLLRLSPNRPGTLAACTACRSTTSACAG